MERAILIRRFVTAVLFAGLAGIPSSGWAQLRGSSPPATASAGIDPRVEQAANAVRIDSLMATVRVLAGVDAFTFSGSSQRIDRRNEGSVGNERAADYLSRRLAGYGLEVQEHTFGAVGRNVVAVQHPPAGTLVSPGIYMISAHYDAVAASPGADDNASGTAAVIEAARILSRLPVPHVLMYALWDEEEWGLVGSDAWVQTIAAQGIDLLASLNLDMIAWDGDRDGAYTTSAPWPGLSSMLEATIAELGLGLNLASVQNVGSDHRSFTRYGYPSTTLIESVSDFNPFYHRATDTPSILVTDYFDRMTRLAVAIVAQLGFDAVTGTAVEHVLAGGPAHVFALEHWPDPASNDLTLRYSLTDPAAPTIRIFDVLGREVERRVPGYLAAGMHVERVETAIWAPGVYLVRLDAGPTSVSRLLTVLR